MPNSTSQQISTLISYVYNYTKSFAKLFQTTSIAYIRMVILASIRKPLHLGSNNQPRLIKRKSILNTNIKHHLMTKYNTMPLCKSVFYIVFLRNSGIY